MNSANNENGADGPAPEEEPAVGDSEPGGAGEPGDISAEAAVRPERSAGRGEASAEAAELLGIELDENFVRGASVIEPSAKERERTAERERRVIKLKRRRRRLRRALTLHDWRIRRRQRKAGTAPMTSDSGRSRLPALRVVIFFVLVAALIGVAIYLPGRSSNTGTAPPVNWNNVTPPPSASANASGSPDVQVSCYAGQAGCGSMDQPFAQSPAEGFANGAAGIALPAATATAGFSQAEVTQDLQQAKRFLVDQNLDPNVLFHSAFPSDLTNVLFDNGVAALRKAFANPTQDNDPLGFVTRFNPATTALIGDVVKVQGTISQPHENTKGELEIHTLFIFVYPVHRPGTQTWTRVDFRKAQDLIFEHGSSHLWFKDDADPNAGAAGAQCGFHNGYLEPSYPDDGSAGPPATGPTTDPFAPPTVGANPAPQTSPTGGSVVAWRADAPTPSPTDTQCGTVSRT